jgi:hypothetical protein
MRHSIAVAGLAALLLASAAAVPASAQTVRDLSVVQSQAYEAVKPKPGPLAVLTLLDRADATYAVGESVRLGVKVSEDAFVTVVNIGASGRVTQLFPNAYQPDNRVRAGETLEIPSPGSGAKITVGGQTGAELIKVIATSKPVQIFADKELAGSGMFRSLTGDVDALNRDLAVVAAKPPEETRVAIANQIIRTIPSRLPGGPMPGTILIVPTPPAPAGVSGVVSVPNPGVPVPGAPGGPVAVAPSAVPTFPLMLAADKASYRVGEPLVIAVTSVAPCHLTVVSANSNGQVRQLFPTALMPNPLVQPGQTLFVSGGGAPQTVVATGPALETVTALCTSDPRPITPVKTAGEPFAEADKAALDRDLAVVPTRPAPQLGLARVTIQVTP